MQIGIFYRNSVVEELYQKNAGVKTSESAGFDLVLCEDLSFSKQFEFKTADLGIIVKPAKGYHSFLLPRSSTYSRYKLIQANSVGLIDEDYSGAGDFWAMPLIYMGQEPTTIPMGTRLCQLVLCKTIPVTEVLPFIPGEGRGGFGSTGH